MSSNKIKDKSYRTKVIFKKMAGYSVVDKYN